MQVKGSILQYFPPSFNLQVLLYSPTIGNKIKYTLNLLRIFFKDNTVCIGQFSKFAMKFKKGKRKQLNFFLGLTLNENIALPEFVNHLLYTSKLMPNKMNAETAISIDPYPADIFLSRKCHLLNVSMHIFK